MKGDDRQMKQGGHDMAPDGRQTGHVPTERARIVIVDDHAVVREGLERILAKCADIEVVGSASSGEEA